MTVTTVQERTLAVFAAIDRMRADEFAAYFAERARFRFGNAPPVIGRDAVEAAVRGFFSTLAGLRHEISGIWTGSWDGGEVTSVEALVTYTRLDGSTTMPIPATSTLRWGDGSIQDYRIYADISPLFETGA